MWKRSTPASPVRGRRATQVVRAEVERQATVAENRSRLLRSIEYAGVTVVREDVQVVAVLCACATIQNLKDHRGERHSVRIRILRGFRGDQPPAREQIHVLPAHRADLA